MLQFTAVDSFTRMSFFGTTNAGIMAGS
jgi:hypothetical protein